MNRFLKHSKMRQALAGFCITALLASVVLLLNRSNRDTGLKAGSELDGRSALEVEPTMLELGDVLEQENFVHVITVRNVSHEPLRIVRFERSCDCLNITPDTAVIPAAGTLDLTCQFDLRFRGPEFDNQTTAPFSVAAVPVFESESSQRPWQFSANVKRTFHVHPPAVDFGLDMPIDGPQASKRVEVTGFLPFDSLLARNREGDCRVTVESSKPSRFLVTLEPNIAAAGEFNGIIELVASNRGDELPPLSLRYSGSAVEDVRATPDTLLLAEDSGGARRSQPICLESRQGLDFDVTRIDAPEGIEATLMSGTNPASQLFEVVANAAFSPGDSGQVHFTVLSSIHPSRPYTVSVRLISAVRRVKD